MCYEMSLSCANEIFPCHSFVGKKDTNEKRKTGRKKNKEKKV